MAHNVAKHSTRATTLFRTSSHLDRRFAHEVMGLQNQENPNFGNLGTPIWESRDKMTFGCWSPSSGRGESCEFVFAHGSFVHQKCSSYGLTNFLFGLCMSVWVIELLVNFPSLHFGALTHPSTLEVLRARERTPTPFSFRCLHLWTCKESIEELGGVSLAPSWCCNLVTCPPTLPSLDVRRFTLNPYNHRHHSSILTPLSTPPPIHHLRRKK